MKVRSGKSMHHSTLVVSKPSGTNKMPKGYELSDDVLHVLDSIALGVA